MDRGKYWPIPVKIALVTIESDHWELVYLFGRWSSKFDLCGMLLEKLMAIFDQPEQQLHASEQLSRRLLEAVLAEALQTSKPALGSESIV